MTTARKRVVKGIATLPDGTPWAQRNVKARLNADMGFLDDGTAAGVRTTEIIKASATAATDMDGLYVFDSLTVNDDINPSGTSYVITVANETLTIQVPPAPDDDPTAVAWVFDCLVEDPTNPNNVVAGLPIPSGSAEVGNVPVISQVSPLELEWGDGGGGGGGSVDSVTAGNSSIVIGGTDTDPTIEVGDLSGTYALVAEPIAVAETVRAEAAEALLAPLASPALTGTPTAPTKSALTNNTGIATTAYTDTAVAVETSRAETVEATKASTTALTAEISRAEAAEALLAPLASPGLTGTPSAPTKTALTNSTAIATTAYADAAVGVETSRAETAEALLAPKASPALTGSPTAPTQSAGDNSTKLATTAYVDTGLGTKAAALTRQNKTGAYTAVIGDLVTCDTTSGTFAVTLPAASGGKGRIVVKWEVGTTANAPTIALTGSDHVNTSSSALPTFLKTNQSLQFESDGTSLWTVTASDPPLADYPTVPPGGFTSVGTSTNTTTPAEAVLYCYPMSQLFANDGTVTFVGFHVVGSSGTTGCVVRIGLYADNGAGKPGALIADFGTGTAVGAASNVTITASQPIKARTRYWWGAVMQGGAATRAVVYDYAADPQSIPWLMIGGQGSSNVGDIFNGGTNVTKMMWTQSGVTGSLPSTFAPDGSAGGNLGIRITFKVA